MLGTLVGQHFGKYEIVRLLGKGGMGEVYEAVDTTKQRTVALKVLADQYSQDERFRERFQRESRAAAIIQEPHVIPIHDWGEVDDHLYIDMRLVPGQTLHDMLQAGPLEPERAVSIVGQIASALDAAHAAGLIHRDVKPQNIMVTQDDFAYLVDFGIAEALGDSHLTMTGTQVGSMAYMAPERFGDEEATTAVDVYSLACVLCQALTGATPFRSDSLGHVINAHISTPPPRPSSINPRVPAALDEVVARGMAKQPDDRYGSAGALARAATRALTTTTAPQDDWATRARPYTAAAPQLDLQGPITGPTAVVGTEHGGRSGRWVVPTVIGVIGALLLGAIGIVIGMLSARNNTPTASSPSAPVYAPSSIGAPQASIPASQQAPPVALPPPPVPAPAGGGEPPLVEGPDNSVAHQDCSEGWSLTNVSGWGTHSGRGSAETSCYFARSVLSSYWNEYGNATRSSRSVSAPGAVDCRTVSGASCDGPNFELQCAAYGSDNWITCAGGNNARVFLF